MASFDFQSHLAALDPASIFTDVRTLSGSLVNLTVRARKDSASQPGRFPSSIVLKYAPPFVAVVGPEAPFSHDVTNFVLALEDLGSLPTLWDILRPSEAIGLVDQATVQTTSTDYGEQLGTFFAYLHSAKTSDILSRSTPKPDDGGDQSVNDSGKDLTTDVVFDCTVRPIQDRLTHHPNVDKLYERVVNNYSQPQKPSKTCFSFGDLPSRCRNGPQLGSDC